MSVTPPPVFPRRRPRALGRVSRIGRRSTALAAAGALICGVVVAAGGAASASVRHAGARAEVRDGDARFEVLTPTLIRLEYAGDQKFQDATTFNVVNRNLPVPSYTTHVVDGYRVIRTADLTLRYKENSGPFTPANTSIRLTVDNAAVTANPVFPSLAQGRCEFGALCEAEDGVLTGGASPADDHTGSTGSGFVAGLEQTGASIADTIADVPQAGTYALTVRYANSQGSDGQTTTRTLSTSVNGAAGPALSFAPTSDWNTWSTVSVEVPLKQGTNTVQIDEAAADSGKVNIDSFALTAPAAAYPQPAPPNTSLTVMPYGSGPSDTLGGWRRGLDGESGSAAMDPGILDRTGWYLLDDSGTALYDAATDTATPRPSHGGAPYEDGYFFGYGHDYQQGLADLRAITGPDDLLPESAYGLWFSRYYAYTTSDYENTLLPAFRSHQTPLDWLVVDTDWKSPAQWDGWNFNPSLFPDPSSFLDWAHSQGLHVSLNVHPSISQSDPQYAQAQATAKNKLSCSGGTCTFDWSDPDQLKAYFDLQKPLEQEGVDEWWLDWCCDASTATTPGITPDSWINQQYAADGDARGQRGFSFSRMGSSLTASSYSGSAALPSGPWAEHRSTLQFTGDTYNTWAMLAFEAEFSQDEGAAVGLPAVTDDIGSFHGDHDTDDMYVRWLQLGTFQPVFRVHSDHGDRLPWDYDAAAEVPAEQFMNLREDLVPYTYTLAKQAQDTGVPMLRALYLDYPEQDGAYTNPTEYLYGPDVLVAPITTPDDANGNGSVKVWFPAGSTWTDYFTGKTYQGGTTATITDSLSQMPVFIRGGGMLVQRTNKVENEQVPLDQVSVDVTAGGDSHFSLYEDAGQGLGYQQGQSATTAISWNQASRTLAIGAARGSYRGQVTSRSYTLRLYDTSAPSGARFDGHALPAGALDYDATTHVLTVTTPAIATTKAHHLKLD